MSNCEKFLALGFIASCVLVCFLAYSVYCDLPPCFDIGPGGCN